MDNLNDKTNNELFLTSKELEHEYATTKNDLIKQLNKLDELEIKYNQVKKILKKRIN
jgi:hypothetical protein